MRRLVLLAVLLPGCVFFFDDDDDDCLQGAPEIAQAQQRNPNTLLCESYGDTCNSSCGLDCPATGQAQPTWGYCAHECETLNQGDCAANPSCRVVEDANCAIGLNCLTNFVACYPIDMIADDTVDCFKADATSCSMSNKCTALHSYTSCPSTECARPFELCVPEGASPGRCWDPVTCDALTPECPSGKTPGVANGCYTGACIPVGICEAQ